MAVLPAFAEPHLRAICDILGATDGPLTGGEIGELLRTCGIDDVPISTKRHRVFEALRARQTRDGSANAVASFVRTAMNPVRFIGAQDRYHAFRVKLNEALAFVGLQLRDDGELTQVAASRTLSEAQSRASELRKRLLERDVHPDVLRSCRPELVQENYFHAVLEATKSVAEKIREKTGLGTDGGELVDQAFGRPGGAAPMLAFNSLRTESEKSEHSGYMNLMKGVFGAFRGPTAHSPKLSWPLEKAEALDVLSIVSLIHRKLDRAVPTRPGSLP